MEPFFTKQSEVFTEKESISFIEDKFQYLVEHVKHDYLLLFMFFPRLFFFLFVIPFLRAFVLNFKRTVNGIVMRTCVKCSLRHRLFQMTIEICIYTHITC